MEGPHDQKTMKYWYYFAAISRAISCAGTMNGEVELPPEFEQEVCNKLTEELIEDSIANGTPVSTLLTECELNEAHHQLDLSDFYVTEYKSAADTGKALFDRQKSHKWITIYVKEQLAEKVMGQHCGEHEYSMTAHFYDKELGKDGEKLCKGCFDEMTAIEAAWSFSEWYKHTQQQQWPVNSIAYRRLERRI